MYTKLRKVWALSFLSRGLNLTCHLAVLGTVSWRLPPEEFGLWIILTGWFTFAPALDLGLGNSIQGQLSILWAKNDQNQFCQRYLASEKIVALVGVVLGVLAIALNLTLNKCFAVGIKTEDPQLVISVLLVAAATPLFLLWALSQRGLIAASKYSQYNFASSSNAVLQLLYILIISKFTSNHGIYLLGAILATLISYLQARNSLLAIEVAPQPLRDEIKKIVIEARPDAISFATIQIMAQSLVFLPPLMIAGYGGLGETATFGGVLRLGGIMIQGAAIVSVPLRTDFTYALQRGDIIAAKRLLIKVCTWLLIIYLFTMISLFGLRNTVESIVKNGLLLKLSNWAWIWFVVYVCAQALGQPLAAFLNGIRAVKTQAIYGSITVSMTLALIPFLFSKYGISGGLASIAVPLVIINLPFAIYETGRQFNRIAKPAN